jgi:cytochrome b561
MQPIRQNRFEQICEKIVHIGFTIMMIAITICAIAIVYAIIVK